MLFSLAENSEAPKFLTKLSNRKVPVYGILVSSGMTLLAVVLNYALPSEIFMYLMSIVTGAVIISWAMIILTHLKFRKHCTAAGIVPKFKAYLYPFANYLCLAFLAVVIALMTTMEEMRLAVMLMPVWLGVIWIFYKLKYKNRAF